MSHPHHRSLPAEDTGTAIRPSVECRTVGALTQRSDPTHLSQRVSAHAGDVEVLAGPVTADTNGSDHESRASRGRG
jgi:hypothetical protein